MSSTKQTPLRSSPINTVIFLYNKQVVGKKYKKLVVDKTRVTKNPQWIFIMPYDSKGMFIPLCLFREQD